MSEQKAPKKRAPKDQAKSVTLALDDETRQKLLNILWLNQKNNKGINIPLSGALRFALCTAHDNIFGPEFDETPEDAVEAFKAKVEERLAARRPIPAATHQGYVETPQRPRPVPSSPGMSPGELARQKRDEKPDSKRGIGKPEKPAMPTDGKIPKKDAED